MFWARECIYHVKLFHVVLNALLSVSHWLPRLRPQLLLRKGPCVLCTNSRNVFQVSSSLWVMKVSQIVFLVSDSSCGWHISYGCPAPSSAELFALKITGVWAPFSVACVIGLNRFGWYHQMTQNLEKIQLSDQMSMCLEAIVAHCTTCTVAAINSTLCSTTAVGLHACTDRDVLPNLCASVEKFLTWFHALSVKRRLYPPSTTTLKVDIFSENRPWNVP